MAKRTITVITIIAIPNDKKEDKNPNKGKKITRLIQPKIPHPIGIDVSKSPSNTLRES